MLCPVTKAIAYGDDKYKEQGYFLTLTLRSGEKVVGSAYTPADGIVQITLMGNDSECFVLMSDVVAAVVQPL